ncbi:MAG TPA: class I SAM-dependent methyltransferase [Anaerolineales bacterium]|nr:class I SAM-dependent methyltransferase [Anaerolineales bacterium]
MNSSLKLAYLYAAHTQRHLEDLPFWLGLAHQADGPILELGCGTGRILLSVLQSGLPIIGLDRDPDMLAVLKEKSCKAQKSPAIVQADMSAFNFEQLFSLIILPCNTISTLSDSSRVTMLNAVVDHLAEGGIFATSLPNPLLLSNLPEHAEPEIEESFPHPLDGAPVKVSSSWEHDQHTFSILWDYEYGLPSGDIEHLTLTSSHGLIPISQYLAEFETAGLNILHQYGDFNKRLFNRRANSLIFVAQKP